MSSFEFILISIAIVVGFGISEILAGWGRQLRHYQEIRPYPLQIVASVYLLSLSLRFLWLLWTLQGVVWTFAGFMLVFCPALILALSAHLLRVDVHDLRRTPRTQYFAVRRPLFALLVLFPVFAALVSAYNRDHFQTTYDTSGLSFLAFLPVAASGILWMMFSTNPRHHWVAWALVWTAHIGISLTQLPSLTTP